LSAYFRFRFRFHWWKRFSFVNCSFRFRFRFCQRKQHYQSRTYYAHAWKFHV